MRLRDSVLLKTRNWEQRGLYHAATCDLPRSVKEFNETVLGSITEFNEREVVPTTVDAPADTERSLRTRAWKYSINLHQTETTL